MKRRKPVKRAPNVVEYQTVLPYTKEQIESIEIIVDTLEECNAEIDQLLGSMSVRTKREGSIFAAKMAIQRAIEYLLKKESR